MNIEKQIQKLGWELQVQQHNADCSQFMDYRAVMGGFCTPWRGTKEQVAEDVKAFKIKPNTEPKT